MGADINKIIRMRDVEIADGMGRQAELGWFDVEFTMYGTAYLAEGELCYRISDQPDDIYHFMEKSKVRDLYCSNVLSCTERCPVPMGMKEEKALDVKKALARQLRDAYPEELFRLLAQIAEEAREDSAYPLLLQAQQELEGCFDESRLLCYEELADDCYGYLKLSRSHYAQIRNWLKRERKNMEDDCPSKDIFEKHFYGLVYGQEGTYHYLEDSLREYIYQRKYDLEQQGIMTTPIFSKTLWYNYKYRLPDARRDFLHHFHQTINAAYLQKWQTLRTPNQHFPSNDLLHLDTTVRNTMGPAAADTLLRYAHRWCII